MLSGPPCRTRHFPGRWNLASQTKTLRDVGKVASTRMKTRSFRAYREPDVRTLRLCTGCPRVVSAFGMPLDRGSRTLPAPRDASRVGRLAPRLRSSPFPISSLALATSCMSCFHYARYGVSPNALSCATRVQACKIDGAFPCLSGTYKLAGSRVDLGSRERATGVRGHASAATAATNSGHPARRIITHPACPCARRWSFAAYETRRPLTRVEVRSRRCGTGSGPMRDPSPSQARRVAYDACKGRCAWAPSRRLCSPNTVSMGIDIACAVSRERSVCHTRCMLGRHRARADSFASGAALSHPARRLSSSGLVHAPLHVS